jgi:hypothetical protein
MTDPFPDDPSPVRTEPRPLSPGAARRRLGAELRSLREAAGLRLEDAGNVLQRSSATMSRMEGGRLLPRLIEHETDAVDIKAYAPELVPGLLQTPAYARVVVDVFFPNRPRPQRDRFVEFRMARQEVLTRAGGSTRFSAVIGESALRRPWGSWSALREQLRSLLGDLNGDRPNVRVFVVPLTAAVPAAMGGPFVLLSSGEDAGGDDLVYLESRSGADYLQSRAEVERFQLYFDSLVESSLPPDEARALLTEIHDLIG